MGNRAVITTEDKKIGIYLRWNGGRDSVEPFLAYCKLKGYREPENDCYGWARLCQVIGNYTGGSTSIGIDTLDSLDCNNYDNGMYIIKGWEIVGRMYSHGEQSHYDFKEMLISIDEAQPENEQLGKEFLQADIVDSSNLKVGDVVFLQDFTGDVGKHTITGQITTQEVLKGNQVSKSNGHNVLNKFFIDRYDDVCNYKNINNFLLDENYRISK